MVFNLIQTFMFFCVCTPLHAMLDYSKEKAHVHTLLFDKYGIMENDNKLPQITRLPFKPAPKLNHSTIIEQHVQHFLNDENIKENFSHYFITHVMINKNSSCFLFKIFA